MMLRRFCLILSGFICEFPREPDATVCWHREVKLSLFINHLEPPVTT
ncbi:hypothetical protein J7K06_05575 [Candidatus Bathyarchaeota archaeon]|nr:hypothetical protein [Candidatus Bathyarchaeota archaeon]